MKSAGKARNNGLYRHIRTSKEIIRNLLNDYHKELRRAFEKITIVADEIGSNEYMQSFCKYVDRHQDMPDLFGDAKFSFEKSENDVRIQIADLISGTLVFSVK